MWGGHNEAEADGDTTKCHKELFSAILVTSIDAFQYQNVDI